MEGVCASTTSNCASTETVSSVSNLAIRRRLLVSILRGSQFSGPTASELHSAAFLITDTAYITYHHASHFLNTLLYPSSLYAPSVTHCVSHVSVNISIYSNGLRSFVAGSDMSKAQ